MNLTRNTYHIGPKTYKTYQSEIPRILYENTRTLPVYISLRYSRNNIEQPDLKLL